MKLIESFKINHLTLMPGIYVSRRDVNGECTVTTFDLRITSPNREPVIDMPALHTIEHMGATFFRNSDTADRVVYFGPMGCRTGFYLLMFGKTEAEEIKDLIIEMCDFILSFKGDIPGALPDQCGNYSEQNLEMAKYYIAKYKKTLCETPHFVYPE